MIQIDITDRATPMLRAVGGQLVDGSLENAMGRGATNLVQRHLFAYNASHPNQLGGKRTNFYSGAAKSTNYRSKPGEVVIGINQVGIRQRWQGGTIRPVRSKYLTIPAIAEAHGRRAREFNNLRVQFNAAGAPSALVEASATKVGFGKRGVRNKGTVGGRVFFWLVKQAVQKGAPDVLPTEQSIGDAAVEAGRSLINQTIAKGGK